MLHLEKKCVLYLNASWLPINMVSIKDAIIAMNGGQTSKPAKAFDIEYTRDENGELINDEELGVPKMDYCYPVNWETWTTLPIREDIDQVIRSQYIEIRVPTVIITESYAKMPSYVPRPTKEQLYVRQKGKCFFTQKPISRNEASLEHLTPRSKGGKDSWENLVITHKLENWAKGDLDLKEYEEIKGKKYQRPKPMPAIPRMANIKPCHRDHYYFFRYKK